MTLRRFLSTLLVTLLGTSAFAQETPPSAGRLLQELRELPPVPRGPSAVIDVAPEPRPAVRESPGLRLDVSAFRVTGLTVLTEAEVLPRLNGFLGPERTFENLENAARTVADQLREDGYFLAHAYLPAQQVQDGVVEIAVLEGRIGQVRVEEKGEVRISRSRVDQILSALPGTVIRDDAIERVLFLLGDLRGLEIRSVLTPGETPGTADLVVTLTPSQPLEATLSVDNLGSRFTGQYRIGASADLNSPLGRGDLLSARVLHGNAGRLTFGRISYLTPIARFGTKIGAAYSRLYYELGTSQFDALDADGSASVSSVFLLHPLARGRNLNLFVSLGYDHRKLRDDFAGLELENERVLDVGVVTLVGDSRDQWLGGGINTFAASFTTGEVELRSTLQQIIDASAVGRRIEGHYDKLNLSASRLQQLGAAVLGFLSFEGQWASRNLDSSEKMSLGGPNAVRAYAEGEAASDSGLQLTAELRRPIPLPAGYAIPGHLIGSLFFDFAHGNINERPLASDTSNARTLAGLGVGLRWGRPDSFLVNATAAWRLTDRPSGDRDRHPRIFVFLSKSF